MTTDKYLSRLSWLVNTIISRDEKINVGRSRATNMVAPTDSDPVQTSPKDTLCEILSGVVDMDKELSGYVAEFKEMMAQVDALSDPFAPAYLFRRYGRCQSVNEIARDMKMSRSTIYRIHRDALSEFEEMWGEIYLNRKNFSVMEHFDTL